MVDLNPISTGAATASSGSQQLTAVTAAITALSSALENIGHTIQTNATPTSLSANGELTLTTAMGSITVNVMQNLAQNEKQAMTQQLMDLIQTQKPVTLTIAPGSNGQAPSQAILLLPAPQQAPPVQTASVALPPIPVNLPPVAAGQTFPAEILPQMPQAPALSLPPQITAQMPTLAPAPVNAAAQPAIVQTQPDNVPPALAAWAPSAAPVPAQGPPAPGPAPIAQNAMPIAQNASTPLVQPATIASAAPSPIPATTPQLSLLQPGANVSVRIDMVLLPQNNAPLPPLAPNQTVATVINQGSDGNLILRAGDNTLFVKTQATAPPGTQFIISVDPAKSTAMPLPLLPDTGGFTALPQAVASLAQAAPQMMQQIMANIIPQPTEALPGALLFLFSAFKQGNVRGWLGNDAAETLTRLGKEDLVNSLSRDLSEAGGPAQDNVVGDWHAFPIPLYAQQQFQALTLYVHHDRDGRDQKASAEAAKKIRFLIDMKLGKLGAMQLDGFVQPKKLDMILRSEINLPAGTHSELRSAYLRATGAVGYAGSLSFQVGKRFWVAMQPPAAKGIVT